jgi:hypothetical protein
MKVSAHSRTFWPQRAPRPLVRFTSARSCRSGARLGDPGTRRMSLAARGAFAAHASFGYSARRRARASRGAPDRFRIEWLRRPPRTGQFTEWILTAVARRSFKVHFPSDRQGRPESISPPGCILYPAAGAIPSIFLKSVSVDTRTPAGALGFVLAALRADEPIASSHDDGPDLSAESRASWTRSRASAALASVDSHRTTVRARATASESDAYRLRP